MVVSHLLSLNYVTAGEDGESLTMAKMFSLSYYQRQLTLIAFHIINSNIIPYLVEGVWKHFPLLLCCYTLPIISHMGGLPFKTLHLIHNCACAVVVSSVSIYFTCKMPKMYDFLWVTYNDAVLTVNASGLLFLLMGLFNKLFVPSQFAVFWLIQFGVKLVRVRYEYEAVNSWYLLVLTAVSYVCNSPVSVLATSVTVSYVSCFVLNGTRAFLLGELDFLGNPMHNGWTEGLSLILLAVQTGVAETEMPHRVAVMMIILFIVLSSLLQSTFEIAEPIVLALSASRNRSIFRHLRTLSVCLVLLIFPLYLTWKLIQIFPGTFIDFWMMVALSSCMLTSVHVIDLLVVHCLFVYDSVQEEIWENLDDIVYYTRAITKILEFFVAVVVVGMGLWVLVSAQWNHVHASILTVHCYFNVWQRLRTGWKSFLLRREAAQKVDCLPAATGEQLQQLDDVCSICYSSMNVACITRCRHYFHRNCLRKWLYVQDKCPLCHDKISIMGPPATPL